jgi:hypothetical protein
LQANWKFTHLKYSGASNDKTWYTKRNFGVNKFLLGVFGDFKLIYATKPLVPIAISGVLHKSFF